MLIHRRHRRPSEESTPLQLPIEAVWSQLGLIREFINSTQKNVMTSEDESGEVRMQLQSLAFVVVVVVVVTSI